MRKALALALLACAAAGCAPPSPGPKVQAMLDFYAPDLQIGDFVAATAHQRYQLKTAPYSGYYASVFRGPDGVGDLLVGVDLAPGDGSDETVSPRARVDRVTLTIPDRVSMALVEARLQQQFGAPEESCHLTIGPRARMRNWYWPGERGRGILLTLLRGEPLVDEGKPPAPFNPRAGGGWLTFGAPVAHFRTQDPDVCD